jgi:hypothetical protein
MVLDLSSNSPRQILLVFVSSLVVDLSSFVTLVLELNQNPSPHGFLLELDLSSVLYPLQNLQHLPKRHHNHCLHSLVLQQIFSSALLGKPSRPHTSWSEVLQRSSFFPSTLVLVHSLFVLLESFIPPGEGSLFGYVGAAEAVGSNPPDDFTLFTITGEVDTPLLTFSEQKFVQARFLPDKAFATFQLRVTETGQQPLDIEGKLDESFTPAPAVATGSLFGFSSTTEASVFNPIDKTTLFTFEGNAAESETNVEIGSGSFFSFQSATEVTAVAEEKQALFSFAGNLQESTSPAPHVTTGGLFGFSSTTEARVIDLPARTTLFTVGGTAVERASIAEDGTPTPGLDVNGNLVERTTFAHAGSGGLFGFSSTTEARVIVPRGLRNLFTVNGDAADSRTRPFIGSGTLSGFVGGAESTSNVEVKYTLFNVTGTPIVKFAGSNVAVGQIRVGLSNPGIPGDISRGITVFRLRTFPQGPTVRFAGTKAESFTPAPHIVEGLVNVNRGSEVTEDRYIEFREPHPTRIVVI